MRPLALALVLAAASGASGCADADSDPAPAASPAGPAVPFRVDGRLSFVRGGDTLKTIDVEIADTDSTRARGLMERPVIPDDTGMLFVFPYPAPQGFYMRNTPRPLDIQFYGADSTLLNVAENTVPYDETTVESAGPAQFVVEVEAGQTRRIGLVPGDRITWSRAAP